MKITLSKNLLLTFNFFQFQYQIRILRNSLLFLCTPHVHFWPGTNKKIVSCGLLVVVRFVRNSHHFMCLRFVQNTHVLYIYTFPRFVKKLDVFKKVTFCPKYARFVSYVL
jgi:hypothetical protein